MNRIPLAVGGALVVAAYAWMATGVRTFTWPARLATGLPCVLVLAAAARWPRRRISLRRWIGADGELVVDRPPDRVLAGDRTFRRGLVAWALVGGSVVAWELIELFQSPRSSHPTISSLLNGIESSHPIHAVVYVLWLAFGWDLLRR